MKRQRKTERQGERKTEIETQTEREREGKRGRDVNRKTNPAQKNWSDMEISPKDVFRLCMTMELKMERHREYSVFAVVSVRVLRPRSCFCSIFRFEEEVNDCSDFVLSVCCPLKGRKYS